LRTAQPQTAMSTVSVSPDGKTTSVCTGESLFPKSDPWLHPPGTNMLPTIWTNAYDSCGNEIPNTLPSTPDPKVAYNLHDGTPQVTRIYPGHPEKIAKSPQDDLQDFFNGILYQAQKLNGGKLNPQAADVAEKQLQTWIQMAIDILEGTPRFNSRK